MFHNLLVFCTEFCPLLLFAVICTRRRFPPAHVSFCEAILISLASFSFTVSEEGNAQLICGLVISG